MSRQPPDADTFTTRVTTHGLVPEALVERARAAVETVAGYAPRPVLRAQCDLWVHPDPARARRFQAHGMLDVSGRIVRARVAAEEMGFAIDRLHDRLRRRLADLAEGRRAARHRAAQHEAGEWRHGDLPTPLAPYFPRAAEEREIIAQPRIGTDPMTPDEAAWELRMLDDRFHLFTDSATGGEAVLHVLDDGSLELLQMRPDPEAEERAAVPMRVSSTPVPVLSVAQARTLLDAEGPPFVFFVGDVDGRGHVIYHRYDGHYGLVGPG